MNRRLVSYVRLGSVGVGLALASACSRQATSSFPEDDSDGGGGLTGGSSSGGSGGASSSGSSQGDDGDDASSRASPPPGTSSGSPGTSSGSPGTTGGTDSGTSGATGASGDSGVSCRATMAAGAIPLAVNFLAPKVLGDGGYAYSYSDAAKGGASSVCLDTQGLCGAGMTGAMSTATWGAGIGVNLDQAMGVSPPVGMFAATGTGISYTLSNLPSQGSSLIIDNGGMDYCAELSAASGTAKWSDFNLTCWAPTPAGALSGAPATATHVNFQVNAAAAPAPFDFCVTAVSFAP